MNMRDDRMLIRTTQPGNTPRTRAALHDQEILTAFGNVPELRALVPAVLIRLAAGAQRLTVARGEILFGNAAHCLGLYVVASGRFMLSVGDAQSGHKVIRLAESGDVIGLAATLLDADSFGSAEALVEAEVVLLPRDVLLDRAARDAQLALALARIAAKQARALALDLESVSLKSGRERIVNYLLACATGGAQPALTVQLPAKKSIIASRLSVTPEYFSRTLHELISAGAIEVNGRQIIIRDAARMRAGA